MTLDHTVDQERIILDEFLDGFTGPEGGQRADGDVIAERADREKVTALAELLQSL